MFLFTLAACVPALNAVDERFDSELVGDTYDVRVVTPLDGAAGLPVLVFRDGDYFHRHDNELARRYADGLQVAVVAVAYQGFRTGLTGGLEDATMDRRARDFTPREVEGFPGTGHASEFEGFLLEELVPWAVAEHGLSDDPQEHYTYGYSAFGMSVGLGLANRPDGFALHCMGSPSVGADDGAIFDVLAESVGVEGRAVVTRGSRESEASMVAIDDWADELEGLGAVDVERHIFEGKNHVGAQKPAFEACLDAL